VDPNLVKIKEAFLDDQLKGRKASVNKPIGHAFNYLSTILGENFRQVDRELDQFKFALFKELKEQENGIVR
jgi:hypothetical protein